MLRAFEQIPRMRGGAQAHLMRCSDENYYVVKFQNNPQHRRVLVNEMLGTRLASRLGLPTAPEFTAVTDVHLIAENERHRFVQETLRDAGVEMVAMEGFAVWTAKMQPLIQ
ncbi:MAG TPA: HipA family kinase [Candidatus Acidoferrum sp.]|nr:HipA family kinase [Candidatus Acidoferrum sp.]